MKEILEKLKSSLTPTELSELLIELSGYYAHHAQLWEDIQQIKPEEWLKLRETSKSDTQAEKKWAMTNQGKSEIILRNRLKTAEKCMAAIKARLRIAEGEFRNQI